MLSPWKHWYGLWLILLLQNCFSTDKNYGQDEILNGTNHGSRTNNRSARQADGFLDSFYGNIEEHTQGRSVEKNMLKRADTGLKTTDRNLERANRNNLLSHMDTIQNSIIADEPKRANRKYVLVPMDTFQHMSIPNFNFENPVITNEDIYLNIDDVDRPINRLRSVAFATDFKLEQAWLEDELHFKSYHDRLEYGTVMQLIKEDEKKKWFEQIDKKKPDANYDEDSIGSKPSISQNYGEFNDDFKSDEKNMDTKFEIYFSENQDKFDDLKLEIEEYFDIMCTHMKAVFGKDSLEIEGLERILRVVKIYSDNFVEFIKDDNWALMKNKIVKKSVFDELQELVKTEIIEDMEKFQKLKKGVLQNILRYYSGIKHEVDACVQSFTWITLVFPKNKCFRPEVYCYLPHRAYELKDSLRHYTVPNPKAVFLGFLAFALQIGVPIMVIVYHLFINPNTFESYVSGEDTDKNFGVFWQQFCPSSLYELHKSSHPTSEFIYKYSTKFIAAALLFLLNGQLRASAKEECKQFRINWSSYALPKTGLIWSRLQNSMSYALVILTTIVLFFQDPSLQSLVLNCLAMVFLMKVDDELANYNKVNNGIGTTNDNGRKILLSYIASGVRNSDKMESCYNSISTKIGVHIFVQLIFLAYVWTFTCV